MQGAVHQTLFCLVRAENGTIERAATLYIWKDPGIEPVGVQK